MTIYTQRTVYLVKLAGEEFGRKVHVHMLRTLNWEAVVGSELPFMAAKDQNCLDGFVIHVAVQ